MLVFMSTFQRLHHSCNVLNMYCKSSVDFVTEQYHLCMITWIVYDLQALSLPGYYWFLEPDH